MELTGNIKARGSLKGSFVFDQANYDLLSNKPRINGVELIGNKTTEDLHIQTGGGGGGGTNNYNNLNNKPKINGVILQDELSLHSLGIQPEIEFPEDPTKYLNGEGNFTTPASETDFSETEVNTGVKWIDGKYIYKRVLRTYNNYSNNTATFNVGNINIVQIYGNLNIGTAEVPAQFFSVGTSGQFVNTYYDKTDYTIKSINVGWTITQYNIIIEYTKN